MYLKYIQIANFRNLNAARFQFAEGANTIIGENDAGKTNAVTAMRILLDSDYYYNTKRLKDSDFSFDLADWRGHWIIISAFFDKLTPEDKTTEVCSEMIPTEEDNNFLKSYIRCEGFDYGVITLFIRPNKRIRTALHNAANTEVFNEIRREIKLTDYEFVYTARSQADFINPETYKTIVGDVEKGQYADPENTDLSILGSKIEILDVWSHLSVVFIDALRDVESELHKPRNPIRRIVDAIQTDIDTLDLETIQNKVRELNHTITGVEQISDIGDKIGKKMDDIIGLVYSPDITLESRIKEDLPSISKNLTIATTNQHDIDLLGLGHLNMLYIALKLVEFEYNRNHEVINIMLIEEPEAHIHTHIQKTLFDKLQISSEYTQVIMTTHSTHLSEIADISKVNVMKTEGKHSIVMLPITKLDEFGTEKLKLRNISLSKRLERYLDAKRSVLLFSKGVVLVEGDAEEIMIPSMIKKSLGVTLDELGIGIINIGSVAFEYVACIFAPERLQRRCAIITDMDSMLDGATKCNEDAAKRGITRQQKLVDLFGENEYVEAFYSNYTFEVDFTETEINQQYFKEIIKDCYLKKETIKQHIEALGGEAGKRYDSVLTVANHIGKGWLAASLAANIDYDVEVPDYINKAIAFAGGKTISDDVIWKMFNYVIGCYDQEAETAIASLVTMMKTAKSKEEKESIMNSFSEQYESNTFAKLLKNMRDNGDR